MLWTMKEPIPSTDADLAIRAVRRDTPEAVRAARAALGELFQRHGGALLLSLTSRLSPNDAEDILQSTWLRVWERLGDFDGRNFRAWLFTVARNLAEDHRRKPRPTALSTDVASRYGGEAPDRLLDEERRRALADCLDGLPPDQAELVRARLRGEAYAELASRMCLSSEQVHRRYHSAKKHLQACVAEKLG